MNNYWNGLQIAGNSEHAFVDFICPTTFSFLLAFVSLEAHVCCDAESKQIRGQSSLSFRGARSIVT